jgi:hypothetical protein
LAGVWDGRVFADFGRGLRKEESSFSEEKEAKRLLFIKDRSS